MIAAVGCSSPKVEICKYNGDRQAAVSLTFDDGIIDDYTLIAPHLDELGMKGTFWICPANIGIDDSYAPRLTWENCRTMSFSGHEISNHSWDHANLYYLTPEEIEAEVVKADDAIETNLGIRPKTFCFPYNAHNAVVDSICSKGRVGMRLFQEPQGQVNSHSTAKSLDAWLDSVLYAGEWGVTMTHGIHHGWDQWEDENVLWDFYARLAERRDSVWVGTFAQVSSYLAERDACRLSVSRHGHTITLTPSCNLDPELFTEPLSARITWKKKSFVVEFDPFGGSQTFDLN